MATRWTRGLLVDLATDPEGLVQHLERHGLTLDEFLAVKDLAAFEKEYEEVRVSLKAHGVSFKEKSKAIADDLLGTMYLMARDAETPPSVRLGTFQSIVKYAGLEPEKAAADLPTGFSVNIMLGDGMRSIDIHRPSIEHENNLPTVPDA